MIIELSIMKDKDYIYQTYSFGDGHAVFKEQKIPSSMDSIRIMEFMSNIMSIYNATNPSMSVSTVDFIRWINDCNLIAGDKIRITDANKSITLTAEDSNYILIDLNTTATTYRMYKSSMVEIGNNTYIPFYTFAWLTGYKPILDKLSGIVLVDDVTGMIFSTASVMRDLADYIKAHHKDIDIEYTHYGIRFGSDITDSRVNEYLYEAIIATHDSIYFSEAYTSLQEQIEHEKLTDEEIAELYDTSEYDNVISYINTAVVNVKNELDTDELPHNIILVNADPYRDELYIPSKPDDLHIRLNEIELDPEKADALRNAITEISDELLNRTMFNNSNDDNGIAFTLYRFDPNTGEVSSIDMNEIDFSFGDDDDDTPHPNN